MKKINIFLLMTFVVTFCSCDEEYLIGDGSMVWFDLSTVDYKHSYNKKENEETHIIEIPASQTDISVFVDKSRHKKVPLMYICSVITFNTEYDNKTILYADNDILIPSQSHIELEIGQFSYSGNGLFTANINANNSQESRIIKIDLGDIAYLNYSCFTFIQAGIK